VSWGANQPKPRQSLDKWDEVMKLANEALGMSRNAETKRQNNDTAGADEIVGEATRALKLRCDFSTSSSIEAVPIVDRTNFIMDDWDDDKVDGY
jgi:hypothetical protein